MPKKDLCPKMRKSPFEFDISVSADKKRRAKNRSTTRGMSGAFETSSRVCDHPDCDEPGKFRAPKSPDNLEEFNWFCMTHVREYNLKWNFFDNHSEEELEAQLESDKVWNRDTQPMKESLREKAAMKENAAWARFGVDDPLEVLGANGTQNPTNSGSDRTRRLPPTERKAIEILDAKDHWSKSQIRKQYKLLVKDLHPDMNGGKRDDEERLQEVVWAWDQLKSSRSFKD